MTERCKRLLLNIRTTGTALDKKIARIMLEKNIPFKNIGELSAELDVSTSSVHRFSQRLGFFSFKHFLNEYVDNQNTNEVTVESGCQDAIEKISKSMRGNIHFITSKNACGIAIIASTWIKGLGKSSMSFFGRSSDVVEFANSIPKEDTIIMISYSGHSLVVKRALSVFQDVPCEKRPKIILLTNSSHIKTFREHMFISLIKLEIKNNYHTLRDHNWATMEFLKIILESLEKYYL